MDKTIIVKDRYTTLFFNESDLQSNLIYHIEENAALTYFFMPAQLMHDVKISFYLSEQSSVKFYAVLPDGCSTISLNFIMRGSYASAFVRGMYAFDSDSTTILRTLQSHNAKNTQSDLSFKGALSGKAYADFEGTIIIEKEADFSNACQQNKNILLSSDARAKSKPQLEIETNEVRCAHGSAIGQLDEQQLFYMRSRGIEPIQAKQLLLRSFFADILDELPADVLPIIQKKIDTVCEE